MRRILHRSVMQRALLAVLALILALAPTATAAAATADEEPSSADIAATEAAATEAAEELTEAPATEPAQEEVPPPAEEITVEEPKETVEEEPAPAPKSDDPADEDGLVTTTQLQEDDAELTATAEDFDFDGPVFGSGTRCSRIDFRYTDGHRDFFWYCGSKGDITPSEVPGMHVAELHISCSYVYDDGNIPGDPTHTIAQWHIVKYRDITTETEPWKDCGQVFVPADPEIELVKTADKTTARVGDTVTYTYKITNTGDVELDNLTLTDDILGNLSDRITVTSLAPNGGTTTVSGVTHLVTEADLGNGTIHNTAKATGTSPSDQTVEAFDDWTVTVQITPALSADWSCTAVTGTTNVPLSSVTLTFARGGGSQTFQTSDTGDFSFAGTGTHDGKIIAEASIVSTNTSLSEVVTPTTSQLEACFNDQPAIEIIKSPAAGLNDPENQEVLSGGTAQWRITVRNTGDVPLSDVEVTDPLAADCVSSLGDLGVNASQSYLCSEANVTADFVNVATATGTPPIGDDVTDSDPSPVTVLTPALTAQWNCPTPGQGSTVTGTTNVPLSSVTLTFARNAGAQTFTTAQVGDFSFAGTGDNAGKVISRADMVSSVSSLNTTVTPTQAQMDACFVDDPSIEIDKRPLISQGGPETQAVMPGGTAQWLITVTNTGNVTLTDVHVEDPLAADCVRELGTLAAKESVTFHCSRPGVTAAFVNVATAIGTPPVGDDVRDSDDSPVTVLSADVTITKGPDAQTVTMGGTATFTIRVTNPNPVTLTNVRVTDALAPDCNRTIGTMAADAVIEYTCTLANVQSSLVNVAVVHTDQTPDKQDDAPVTVIPAPNPAIAITKQFSLDPFLDPQTVVSGEAATWEIQVTNTGNTILNNVTVSDQLAPDCDRNLGTLAVGQSAPVYSCSRANVLESFTNRADVVGTSSPDGGQVTDSDTAPVSVIPQFQEPSVLLRKTATAPECPQVGDAVTYRFEVINDGTTTLTDITVEDPLLGGEVALPTTTLPVGQTLNATVTHTLTQADLDAGSLTNTATAEALSNTGAPVSSTGQAVVMLEDCPDVQLVKDGPDQAQVGEQITYTFTVTNSGNVTLTNVRIFDERLQISGLPVNPSTLAPGQQGTVTAAYTVTEADGEAGAILNTAMVRARTPDDTEIDDSDDHEVIIPITVETPEPGIQLEKDGPATADVGETITYRFTVTNTGDVTLTNVNITDPLLGLDRLTVRPSTLAPDEQGTATATYVITQADADAGSVYNTAVARGRTPNDTTVRDDDDHTVEVPFVPTGTPPAVPPRQLPPPELPATGLGSTGFALTALLSLALGGVLLGIAGTGNMQAAMANSTVNADSPMLAMLRRWNLAPKPGGSQARRRRRR